MRANSKFLLLSYSGCKGVIRQQLLKAETTEKSIMFPLHSYGSNTREPSRLLEAGYCSFSIVIVAMQKTGLDC